VIASSLIMLALLAVALFNQPSTSSLRDWSVWSALVVVLLVAMFAVAVEG
jgi:uncharacterized membrane-anchored protein